MSRITYLKSAVSHWFVHQSPLLRRVYFGLLRPLYMKQASRRELRQWKRLGLPLWTKDQVGNKIQECLELKKPFTAAKIGATEFFALRWWLGEKVLPSRVHDLYKLSGIFPDDQEFFRDYMASFANSLQSLDLLGLWTGKNEPDVYQELGMRSAVTHHEYFSGDFPRTYGGDTGWFPLMKGYRVLVISSFAELINHRANENDWSQYWGDRFPWPQPKSIAAVPFPYGFEKATQEIYGDSLNLLELFKQEHQVALENSDLVLLGCGGYAIPLLEWIRNSNKVGVHLGGHIQLLFGIKGGRWDAEDGLYNEHWVRPGAQVVPSTAGRIENGCYW